MTISLSIWWLWGFLIGVYVLGVLAGMYLTLIADDIGWYQRPLILIWPPVLAGLLVWRLGMFMLGRD